MKKIAYNQNSSQPFETANQNLPPFSELEKAIKVLQYSFDKCETLKAKRELDPDELETFEALSARFARASDILTQKAIKSLLKLLQEEVQTSIDTANFL